MLASRREKKEEYLAAPAILGETSILAGCLQELATRHAVVVCFFLSRACFCSQLASTSQWLTDAKVNLPVQIVLLSSLPS